MRSVVGLARRRSRSSTHVYADPANRYAGFGQVRSELAELLTVLTGEATLAPIVDAPIQYEVREWLDRGRGLAALRHHEEALACFERVVATAPDWAAAWYFRAASLNLLERNGEALEAVDCALKLDERSAHSWYLRGEVLRAAGRKREAITALDRAIELDPTATAPRECKGLIALIDGHFDLALECFRRSIDLAPEKASPWLGIGNVHMQQSAFEEALHGYERALELDPTLEEAHRNKTAALILLGRTKEAAAWSTHAFVQVPSSDHGRFIHATALAAEGRYAEARESLRLAAANFPASRQDVVHL